MSVGVTAIVLSGGFIEDIFIQLREATIHSQLGHIQVHRAGYSKVGRRNPFEYLIEDPGRTAQELSDISEVSEVLMRVDFFALASTDMGSLPIVGEGVEPDKESRLGSFLSIVAGRQLTDSDTFGILVGEGAARALRLGPGDSVTVLANTADGALNSQEFEVVGVFRSFSRDYDNRAIRIHLGASLELLAIDGVHRLVFSLTNTKATDSAAQLIDGRLEDGMFEIRRWYEMAGFYEKTVNLYRRQFAVLQVIILVMVLLSVANSVNMAINERTGEFGTLMALGEKGRGVFRLIMVEIAFLGVLGATLGVVMGVLLAWSISQLGIPMPPPPNSNSEYTAYIRIVPSVIFLAFVTGVVATALSAILPARRAMRIPITVALRENY